MEKSINSKFIRFVAVLLVSFCCVTAFPQRFGKHDVCLPDKGILTATVKIWPPYTFSIKKDNRLTWAEYEISDKYVIFSVPVNTTKNSRDCVFILLDGEGNPVDTLKLTQLGKTSSTASKVAVNSTTRSKSATSAKKTSMSSSISSSGGQCAARTKKGTRCSRKASAGSIYCWQHNK